MSSTISAIRPCHEWKFIKKATQDGAEFIKNSLNKDIIAPAISMSIILLGTYAGYKAIEAFFRESSSPQSRLFAPEESDFSPLPIYENTFSFLVRIILLPLYLPFMIILLPFYALYTLNRIALSSILDPSYSYP